MRAGQVHGDEEVHHIACLSLMKFTEFMFNGFVSKAASLSADSSAINTDSAVGSALI